MLSRLTLLAFLLVYVPQDVLAVEDLVFKSGFEGSDSLPLPAPSELIASPSSTTAIDLAWTDNSSTETGFIVEHSSDGSNWAAEASMGANVTVYSDMGLAPASTHYYRVRAFDPDRNSTWSNSANATTDDAEPPPLLAPSGLIASATSSTVINLAWNDNSSTETGFAIEHSHDGNSWVAEVNVGTSVNVYSDTGLAPASTHYYRVRAFDADRNSTWSNSASSTTDEDVTPPSVDYVAFGDSYGSGEVFGTYLKTQVDDGDFQQFTEKVSGGKPKDQTTFMGHFWRFNIASGDLITLHANAWQSASSDGDNFVFSWSDDNITYTDMFILSSQSDLNMESGTIPNSVSGPVWIRVIDTDRTPGNNRSRDSLFVDHLFIRVTQTSSP